MGGQRFVEVDQQALVVGAISAGGRDVPEDVGEHDYLPAWARFSSAMSSFFILSIACITFPEFFAPSAKSSPIIVGAICQERPNLSFSQPHGPSWPPSQSFDQK